MRGRSRFPPFQPSQVTRRVPGRAYRSERVAELAVQVHRSRPRAAQDARGGVGRCRPDPRGRAVPGGGEVGVVPREGPEDLALVDGLVGARAAQLGGSVRGEQQERRRALGGFHRRGEQVGYRRAAAAYDGGAGVGGAGALADAERVKGERALVHAHHDASGGVSLGGERQRRAPRSRRDAKNTHAVAEQLTDQHVRPRLIGVGRVCQRDRRSGRRLRRRFVRR